MKNATRWCVVVAITALLAGQPARANPIYPQTVLVPLFVGGLALVAGAVGVVVGTTVLVVQTIRASKVSFVREELTITLSPDRARVDGRYHFHLDGKWPKAIKIRYPFPRGSYLGKPEHVVVQDAAGRDIPFSFRRNAAVFDLPLEANRDTELHVVYEQECRSPAFTYILKSTRAWYEAIEEASFVVEVPSSFPTLKSNLPLERVETRDGSVRYELHAKGFYPDEDLELSWEPLESEGSVPVPARPVPATDG